MRKCVIMDIIDQIKTEIDAAIGQTLDVAKLHIGNCLDMAIDKVIEQGIYDQPLLKNTFYQLERVTETAIDVMLDKAMTWIRANSDRFAHRPSMMEVYMNIEIGKAEVEKADKLMMNALKKLMDKPLVEKPVMEINQGLIDDDRRLLATYCHRLIRDMGATSTWNEEQFLTVLCLLRIEYAICKKDNVMDLFVNSLMSFLNRLNTSNYKQQAKDAASSALAMGYQEHIEEQTFVIGCANYTDSGNYVMALFYMLIAMAYLDRKGGKVAHRLSIDIIREILKIIRGTRKYKQENVDMLLEVFDNLHATDFESISIHQTALTAKLYIEDETVIADTLRYLKTYEKQHKEYEVNLALPLYTYFMSLHEVFPDEKLAELKPYEDYWKSKVKRKGNELYLDFYDDQKSLYDHLKVLMAKLGDIRNTEDYQHDCQTAQFIAMKVLDEAVRGQSTEKYLVAMALRSDYTFIMPNRYSGGKGTISIKDVKAEDVKSDYGDVEHLKEWMHITDNDMVVWLGRGRKHFNLMTLYKNLFKMETIERWDKLNFEKIRKDIVSNLKYSDDYKTLNGETYTKTLDDLREENVKLMTDLFQCRFLIPSFPERLLFVKDMEIGAYPHQLLIDEGREEFVGEIYPSANVLSTEFLTEHCSKTTLTNNFTKAYWSPDSFTELTFGCIMDQIEDTLQQYGFDIRMDMSPVCPLSSELNIVCAHGGKNISESEWFSADGMPIKDPDTIIGAGKLLILLVCHSGSISHREYEHVMQTIVKRYIRIGYKSVIAPMWSLAHSVIPKWLPVFLERLTAGDYVVDAVYKANMNVRKKLVSPAAWACLHLYGDPYLKVER